MIDCDGTVIDSPQHQDKLTISDDDDGIIKLDNYVYLNLNTLLGGSPMKNNDGITKSDNYVYLNLNTLLLCSAMNNNSDTDSINNYYSTPQNADTEKSSIQIPSVENVMMTLMLLISFKINSSKIIFLHREKQSIHAKSSPATDRHYYKTCRTGRENKSCH